MNKYLIPRIIYRITKISGRSFDRPFVAELLELMKTPKLNTNIGWRYYIDRNIKRVWGELDLQTQLALYLIAFKADYEAAAKDPVPATVPYHGQRGRGREIE